jgi:HSP20 family protein
MKSNSKEVALEFALPGFNKKDVKVKLAKDSLAIKAEKKHENKIQKKDFYHHEKSYQHFSYATTLPKINPKNAKISFSKGKLKIKAQKK